MDPKVFVSIDKDGTVTIVAHRSEMGTGRQTALPMIIADEMEADWARVKVIQAPGDEPAYGNQDTDGSRSVRHYIQPHARHRCVHAPDAGNGRGAQVGRRPLACARPRTTRWFSWARTARKPARSSRTGNSPKLRKNRAVPDVETVELKKPSEFRYMAKNPVRIVDLHDITTGHAIYGADVRMEGLKYAVMARPPVIGAKIKSFDPSAALKVPGVEAVYELEGKAPPAKFASLGWASPSSPATPTLPSPGRDALKIDWDMGLARRLHDHAVRQRDGGDGQEARQGRAQSGRSRRCLREGQEGRFCSRIISSTSHRRPWSLRLRSPASPTARSTSGRLLQSSYGARKDISDAYKVPEGNVTVNVTLLGGGFGRKSKCDYALEAVELSKRSNGAPVMLVWTREDDLRNGFYHTTSCEYSRCRD